MNKLIKKLALIIPSLLLIFVLISCNNGEVINPSIKINQVANNLLTEIDEDNITEDITLPTNVDGVKVSWNSSNKSVLSDNGSVNRQSNDVSVSLIAILAYKSETMNKSFSLTIKGTTVENPVEYSAYYQGVDGLTGSTLKSFLHELIDDHKTYDYDFAKIALKETDEDPNNPNNVILFYTGRSEPKANFGGAADQWNREHVWAKSHGNFGEVAPAGTDLFNLRPTDTSVNSTRGNKDFDEGGTKVNDVYGVNSTYSYTDSDSFEPRDEVKGDVARILFYMAVRYEGEGTEPDLELNNSVNNDNKPYFGSLTILLKWNQEDPVDDFERNRNEVIYSYQHNRNPFVDYPEFANEIWGTQLAQQSNKNFEFNDSIFLKLYSQNKKEKILA